MARSVAPMTESCLRTVSSLLILTWSVSFAACGTESHQRGPIVRESITRESVYAMFGSPDRIEAHSGDEWRPIEEGGGYADSFPFEDWHYAHLDGIGNNIVLEFVDDCMCDKYELVPTTQNEKIITALTIEERVDSWSDTISSNK